MSLKIKIATCTLAVLTIAGLAGSSAQAQEGHRPPYIDAGPMSGAFNDILDSALAANRAYYGTGNPHCPWVRTSDRLAPREDRAQGLRWQRQGPRQISI